MDLNGKKQSWQGVALLPFVDEKRLMKALEPLHEKLNTEECNQVFFIYFFVEEFLFICFDL